MTVHRFCLCAIPAPYWTGDYEFARFAVDALACERRIAKGVNLENEFNRYTTCCQRLEQEVMLSKQVQWLTRLSEFDEMAARGKFPAIRLSQDYLYALREAVEEGRIGASFFMPEQLPDHATTLKRWASHVGVDTPQSLQARMNFLQAAVRAGCGVVEVQTGFHVPEDNERNIAPPPFPNADSHRYVEIPEFVHDGIAVESFKDSRRKQQLADNLRQRILASLRTGEPVTFGSEAQHDLITEVLNEFVFVPKDKEIRPTNMRVMYVDGSEAEAFPLFCLPRSSASSSVSPLRVALMSMRHPELDPSVDFCWFRNRDVSRARTLAETDQFCLNATLSQLRDSLSLGDLLLHVYHTGFEPAVLGLYRGVVQTLLKRQQRGLVVVPQYYRGPKGYQEGQPWC